MKYRLAIFDLDGTLVSFHENIYTCIVDALFAFGYPAPSHEEVKATIGLTLEDSLAVLIKDYVPREQLPPIVEFYRRLHEAKAAPRVRLFDGVVPLLEELPTRQIKSVVVGGRSRAALAETLEQLRIWAFFDLTLSAEDVTQQKPDPALYKRHVAPRFPEIGRAETLVVGDTEIDIRFAKAAGLSSCWASYGYGDADKCRALRPDHEIAQIWH